MAFDDVMNKVMQWGTAAEALGALGAELSLEPGGQVSPEVAAALRAVSTAAGVEFDDVPPPQRAMAVGIIRLFLHTAVDLLENPERPPGWTFTDPAILEGIGRGSSMVPASIAAAHPDLADVDSFLDVGTGVGWLAVTAANVWPKSTVVGIDPYEVALERARTNVSAAGLDDRITLRQQELAAIDDVDAFDCVWIPTFFLTETVLEQSLPPVMRAVKPGGWVVLGRQRQAPDPVADAVGSLRWIRGGGGNLDPKRAVELLEQAGGVDVHIAQPSGPSPIELVLGRRPTG